ncbi:MAG: ADP-ribosylglycohydrolase family protein [Thermoguttaceae bacterium]|nr:ADP-ribosylglycohydrolase family protein [Thermoguttaceae bacterium]
MLRIALALRFRLLPVLVAAMLPVAAFADQAAPMVEIDAEALADKIHGGLVGQLLGNLNGLPHEMKYIDEPGRVERYVPGLPEGARTDDDTDLEWVYVVAIERGELLLPPGQIAALWKAHLNDRIWCANLYARQLIDLGFEPPLTGQPLLNPWSDFNLSGQFVCESFGLMSPGMPQTAGRIGLHYTRVAIDGEPAQTTQLFTAMIATAFFTDRLEEILEAGVAAVDRQSQIYKIVADVRRWHGEQPDDWRATRAAIKGAYSRHGGAMRDRNGYELNTASTVAALLYGQGDFAETLRLAFNFGWDADNNAATAGSILGVVRGRRWFDEQGWTIRDRYQNTSRPGLPRDETISRFAGRLTELADRVIRQQGGEAVERDGRKFYRIRTERPAPVEPLTPPREAIAALRARLQSQIDAGLAPGASAEGQARAAYLAICLDRVRESAEKDPAAWSRALESLEQYPGLLKALRDSPTPAAKTLVARLNAAQAGLQGR